MLVFLLERCLYFLDFLCAETFKLGSRTGRMSPGDDIVQYNVPVQESGHSAHTPCAHYQMSCLCSAFHSTLVSRAFCLSGACLWQGSARLGLYTARGPLSTSFIVGVLKVLRCPWFQLAPFVALPSRM